MPKKSIETSHEKNRIINNIIDAILANGSFLILGHENPDEDCLASTVAIALILAKFSRQTGIYQSYPVHEHFNYLMNICSYNSIDIIKSEKDLPENIDIIICCDTPKPSMLDRGPVIEAMMKKPGMTIIEFDHHIGGDSEYIGSDGYAMVSEASSASELVGYLSLKLRNRKELLSRYNIEDPLSRNFVLAVLTGIIGDSKMGNVLKSWGNTTRYSATCTAESSQTRR
jgi:nanoRNase/pAp phosphatase (c-di-AMP/oligoRNAs hydrolase)